MNLNNKIKKPSLRWITTEHDKQVCEKLSQELGLSLPIATVLVQKGYNTAESAEKFLNPQLADLPSPFLMKGMDQSVSIIESCLFENTPVLIYGDYDVDGTTGAAVLGIFLSEIGLSVSYCQPSRFENGYGLHSELLKKYLVKNSAERELSHLLITVDCGISNNDAVVQAKEMGFKVIITDHHQPPKLLPDADAIINPWQPQCDFPFKHLAGVGVAFYLAMGIRSRLSEKNYWKTNDPPNLREYLDLVALGTIGDMVPLTGVNRILAKGGLLELSNKNRPGIHWLLRKAGCGKQVNSEDVSFQLAPRINAAGRLGKAQNALQLFLTKSDNEAQDYAEALDQANKNRKDIEKDVFQQALELFEKETEELPGSIVVSGEDWHLGILGIVASKFVRMFYRPVIVLSIEEEIAKGSARSIPGINILEILDKCNHLLESYGGHKAAAGVKLKKANIQSFKLKFEEEVLSCLGGKTPEPELIISYELGDNDVINSKILEEYFSMGPFGKGNRKPIFQASTKENLTYPKVVGSEHLKFKWKNSKEPSGMEGIGFSYGYLVNRLKVENGLIAFSLQKNSFKGLERAQLFMEDICLAG